MYLCTIPGTHTKDAGTSALSPPAVSYSFACVSRHHCSYHGPLPYAGKANSVGTTALGLAPFNICLQCLLSILVGAAQSRVGVALVFLHLLSVCLILFCISYLTLTMWSCHNNFFSVFCCVWYRSVFHLAVGFTASRGRLLVYMMCMRMIWVITGAQLDIKYFK